MVNFQGPDCTIAVFTATYEHYLQAARGFADNSCKLHLRVVRAVNCLAVKSVKSW
jgi:hypothetical protein